MYKGSQLQYSRSHSSGKLYAESKYVITSWLCSFQRQWGTAERYSSRSPCGCCRQFSTTWTQAVSAISRSARTLFGGILLVGVAASLIKKISFLWLRGHNQNGPSCVPHTDEANTPKKRKTGTMISILLVFIPAVPSFEKTTRIHPAARRRLRILKIRHLCAIFL